MKNKILIILGHPRNDSFGHALAETYAAAARQSGAEVRELRLGELKFDPLLAAGYAGQQPLEPALVAAQDSILWAEHIVWVYPLWWGSTPALLKGFIDRTLLPGFAFRYRENSAFWDKLLTGRSADIIVTMDTPPWYYRWVLRSPGVRQMKESVLGFCGIKPVRVTLFGPVRSADAAQRGTWLRRATALATAA